MMPFGQLELHQHLHASNIYIRLLPVTHWITIDCQLYHSLCYFFNSHSLEQDLNWELSLGDVINPGRQIDLYHD